MMRTEWWNTAALAAVALALIFGCGGGTITIHGAGQILDHIPGIDFRDGPSDPEKAVPDDRAAYQLEKE